MSADHEYGDKKEHEGGACEQKGKKGTGKGKGKDSKKKKTDATCWVCGGKPEHLATN